MSFLQLYKAADNSCLATHTHGSRINRACFTSVTGKDGAAQWRMVTVCDNKTVNMFDFEGNQVYNCATTDTTVVVGMLVVLRV